ncbi:MAG: heavy metal-binding domain-containing protein [Vicingaceae bacterium]|nr:hypothetical protein [Flavobacteriales bacterium]MDF1674665.1 heavy metal-binding domain-containing protein [Vicingaceae bacterium]
MKRTVLTVGIAMLFAIGSATFIGCGSEDHHDGDHHEHVEGEEHHEDMGKHDENEMHEEEEEHAMYQCPMKCEGDKIYEKEGSCPKCGMDLKEVEE